MTHKGCEDVGLGAEPAWGGFKRAKGQSISEGDAEVGAVSLSLSTP